MSAWPRRGALLRRCSPRADRQLVAAALVMLCVGCSGSGGSCVGPYLDDQPPSGVFGGPTPTVRSGGAITIYGHWYTTTCNDTGGHDPLQPLAPVHLTVTLPGGDILDLGTLNPAGPDMGFAAEVHVPAGTPAGTATIRDDRQHPATYEFEVKR